MKTIVLSLILASAPVLAAADCGDDRTARLSCANGTVYDAASQSCVPVSG